MILKPLVWQRIVWILLAAMTLFTLVVLFFIIGFIASKGVHVMTPEFLFGMPERMGKEGGILPTIIATIYITLLAVAIATPLGVGSAVYLTEYTRESAITRVIRFGADALAGVPSIIFGLFGFILFVIRLRMGWSLAAGGLTLAFMILPTIIRTSEEAIRAVPRSYREVSYGLGSTRWQMVTRVVLRSALPGIGTGIVLSIGRSISETAAVMLTAGSALGFPRTAFDSSRTLALHFYVLSREGLSMTNAYATASILILAILLINLAAYWLMRRFVAKVS